MDEGWMEVAVSSNRIAGWQGMNELNTKIEDRPQHTKQRYYTNWGWGEVEYRVSRV